MRFPALCALLLLATGLAMAASNPVLKRSDVVFMYQADRNIYEAYGGTMLAWGGTPTPQALAAATNMLFFGSVGMVTEFSRYYEFDPATYEAGLCRDRKGQPYKVPWLTDHQHQGIPFWWCCTSQPRFQAYLSNRVAQVVRGGAHGVHIDDHLGSAGSLWLGGCFCNRCLQGFRGYVAGLPDEVLKPLAVSDPKSFDFREQLNQWMEAEPGRKQDSHPLWQQWRIYHLRTAADFMGRLRKHAEVVAGRKIPMSANAGLLWPQHLSDHQHLDFFSAETDHHAGQNAMNDHPILAYRIADAVNRPLASTAAGQDWAHIKEQNRPGLVHGWIALGYASGHSLMAPNRQWCYTSEKGTHWYNGPQDKFAPLYQFARTNAHLLEGFENHAQVVVAVPHRLFDRDPGKLRAITTALITNQLSYSLALGGDDYVQHPLTRESLGAGKPVLVLNRQDFTAADRKLLDDLPKALVCEDLGQVFEKAQRVYHTTTAVPLRVFPRVSPATKSAVLHLVHWGYSAETDSFPPLDVVLSMRPELLNLPNLNQVTLHTPGEASRKIHFKGEGSHILIPLPKLPVWSILELN